MTNLRELYNNTSIRLYDINYLSEMDFIKHNLVGVRDAIKASCKGEQRDDSQS